MPILFNGKRFKAREEAQRIYVTDKICDQTQKEFIGNNSFEQAKKRARNLANRMKRFSDKNSC